MYRIKIDRKFDKKPKVKGGVLILDPLSVRCTAVL